MHLLSNNTLLVHMFTRGKKFLKNFISSRDEPVKGQKQDRGEKTRQHYLLGMMTAYSLVSNAIHLFTLLCTNELGMQVHCIGRHHSVVG